MANEIDPEAMLLLLAEQIYPLENLNNLRKNFTANRTNQADASGWTPLALAVVRRMNMDLIRLLLELGAAPDVENEAGDTAMFLAIEDDYEYMVLELAWHADPTFVSSNGDSSLSVAKWFGNSRIVSRLESMGFQDTGRLLICI